MQLVVVIISIKQNASLVIQLNYIMGSCQSTESRRYKIDLIRKGYPLYHNINPKDKGYKHTLYNIETYKTCINFIEMKNKLSTSNHILYKKFFDKKNQSKRIEVDDIKENEDKELFYFFFNKRIYKELSITNSQILFPKFSFQYFPIYKEKPSTLTRLLITNSSIQFDDKIFYYIKLDNCISIELSYCNIETLPELFCKLKPLQKLCLRRNLLKTLPKLFSELKNLIELDLSENKFNTVPKEILLNEMMIMKLNMNANILDNFDLCGNTEKSKLEYLFLAQNNFSKIPSEIKKLFNLKYVNLDENNIIDKTHSIIDEIQFDLKISCFKNKGINEMIEITKQEVLNKHKIKEKEKEKKTYSKLLKQQSLMIDNMKMMKTSDIQTLDTISNSISYECLKIQSPKTQIEHEVAQFVNELIDESRFTKDKSEFNKKKKHIYIKQYFFMMNKIEHLINIGREKDLGTIENYELKDLFKKCYGTYLKMKEYKNTSVLPCRLDDMDYLEKQYFISKVYNVTQKSNNSNNQSIIDIVQNQLNTKEDNIIKQREDVSNLIFLKHINQLIATSKVTMFLQYLSNIDVHIKNNILNLWESNDNNAFILILTEMKLFIKEMIDYYKTKMKKGIIDVRFNIITSEEKNVIHM